MSFDRNFKLNLTESLRKNKGLFYNLMVKNFKEQYNDQFIFSYYNPLIALRGTENADIKRIWEDFKDCLDKDGFPELIKVYHFFYSATAKDSSIENDSVVNFLKKKSDFLESAFWSDASMVKLYEEVSDFNCFIDLVIKESQMEKYKQKRHMFNASGWCDYYLRLLQLFLPNYQFNNTYSGEKVWRFLCEVSNGYHVGFEFDASFYKSELERYRLFSPEFRIVLISPHFNKSVRVEEYIHRNAHSEIFILSDKFQNPYFPGVFKSIETLFSEKMLTMSFVDFVKENDGIHIRHNKSLGELFKRYAFFDFYIGTFFIKPYLEYISFSIKNIGDQVSDESLLEHLNNLEMRNQFLLEEIQRNETLIAQFKNQKVPKKLLENVEMALSMLKNEYEANAKEIQKMKK